MQHRQRQSTVNCEWRSSLDRSQQLESRRFAANGPKIDSNKASQIAPDSWRAFEAARRGHVMGHKRLNYGLFLPRQNAKPCSGWPPGRPRFICPDHLALSGLIGGLLTAVGFAACHISPYFLALALFGLFLNWLGDSLDGTLARYRKIERPEFGYFVDHSCDLIAFTFIFLGLGVSPYFTLPSALFALSMYLLMSSYTYLKVFILRRHQLASGGMGATEMRLLIAFWALFALWAGPEFVRGTFLNFGTLDAVIGVLWMLSFFGFMWIVANDLSKIEEEPRQSGGPSEPPTNFSESPERESETSHNTLRVPAELFR
jgi:phosphatidylglycerophosphate synthase